MQGYKRFLIKALQHSHNKNHQGFVLPMMIGLGLIMTVVGLTMIGRSSDDQIRSTLEEQTAQALATAETGATRTLASLNQPNNSELLTLDIDDWENPDQTNNPCLLPDKIDEIMEGEVNNQGRYQIIDYQYDENAEEGRLRVQGKVGEAKQEIKLVVDVLEEALDDSFGGLVGIENVNLRHLDVRDVVDGTLLANVLCQDCTLSGDDLEAYCNDPSSSDGQNAARNAVRASQNSIIDGSIFLGELNLPEVPPPENANEL
ncbi:hypothetical protein FRE64_04670 [Euhalothece natronophila Z-M001]|uniref:Uncharacterized protein n=1 Tax=Euhalothece natronophila Z-M001 TaxID=522448 RepID=A0A5B8NLY4_9CHRO|nr:hypothetical protein [Euhalothece natronophila]QDZ39285.1 hypothetical protein FRE64_04670 [Euhalothece natronophila Z-M001]